MLLIVTVGLDEIDQRIEEIKSNGQWYDISTEFVLSDDWNPDNAIWQICKYLAQINGYMCCICKAVWCKEWAEGYTQSQTLTISDEQYHPYELELCGICKKFSMIQIDRNPELHDKIVQHKIPKWQYDDDCKTKNLHYTQMLQHQLVWAKDISDKLNPVNLDYLPYFHKNGESVTLVNPDSLTQFRNIDFESKNVELNIKLGMGFKVWVLRDTNQVFIVGGLGSEKSTHIYNPDTNLIETTKFDLKYARMGHSLWTKDNLLICTGSSIIDEADGMYTCRRVEVFNPINEWWVDGASLYQDRCNHYSICISSIVYVMFGHSPKYEMPQEGIEFIKLERITHTNGSWTYDNKADSWKLNTPLGIMPYPYDEKILILGNFEQNKYSDYGDEDEPKVITYDR